MAVENLFGKFFLFACTIFFANIGEYYAYVPPAVKVEALSPVGIRLSLPDEYGITLVAFHIKFNENFNGLEAGHIAVDILKADKGRWSYENRINLLKRDDIIYYWVHVVYQGLGYNSIDQSYRVTEFYNYDGTSFIANSETEQVCSTKSATWVSDKNGERRQVCPNQLIFEENFDDLDDTKWNTVQRFSGVNDHEFVIYMTNEVTDINDGQLRITPTLVDDKFGNNFVPHGELSLEGCTGEIGTKECQRQGTASYILPPVISGRVNTKGKFEFLFGRVEIRARLPRGDWVYPVITLESTEGTDGYGKHREIRIASAVGNDELVTATNKYVGGRILKAGGLTISVNEGDTTESFTKLPNRPSSKLWSDGYHIFEIEWKSGLVIVKVDGIRYGEQIVDIPFGKQSYLTLGVAVGGIHEFPDFTTSTAYDKPWRNDQSMALFNFYRAKDLWHPTWNAKTSLHVDYVKVWAL